MNPKRINKRRQQREEKKAAAAAQQPEQRPAGFQCPKCNFFIQVSIESLLYQQGHTCPSCMTVFTMDRQESQDALTLMQKLHTAMKDLDSVKKFEGGK